MSQAEEKQLATLKSVATSRLSGELSSYLDSRLAERTSVPRCLGWIFMDGCLIQGDIIREKRDRSELVKRGHRL